MSSIPQTTEESFRDTLIERPDIVLEDPEVMRALVSASERAMGANIVDLRGIAMDRLEARLDRLEDTHRSVIAAAYENLAGTNQVHRAVLRMLDPTEFEPFLRELGGEVAEILRVDCVRLVLESPMDGDASVERLDSVLSIARPGYVAAFIGDDRDRPVTLRQVQRGAERIYGTMAPHIRSEACLRLDLGEGRLPGLLILGSEDPHQFTPQHGTDLLGFFGAVFERAMRRWLG